VTAGGAGGATVVSLRHPPAIDAANTISAANPICAARARAVKALTRYPNIDP